jgi:hypothetical protein
MPTTLQDAVIRVKLDPGRAVQDVKDRERAEERIGQARARTRAKEIEREWGRVEKESEGRILRGARKIAGLASTVTSGPGGWAAAGARAGAGAAAEGALGASTLVKTLGIAGAIAAATVAGEYVLTSVLPTIGSGVSELAKGTGFEWFADSMNSRIQGLADQVSEISAKVTQFIPAVGQTAEMVSAQIRLGGEIPTAYEADDTFGAIFKMKQAEKQFEKSIDRDRNSHMARMLARAMKGGQG